MSKPMFKSSLISAFTKVLGQKEEEKIPEEKIDFEFNGGGFFWLRTTH